MAAFIRSWKITKMYVKSVIGKKLSIKSLLFMNYTLYMKIRQAGLIGCWLHSILVYPPFPCISNHKECIHYNIYMYILTIYISVMFIHDVSKIGKTA